MNKQDLSDLFESSTKTFWTELEEGDLDAGDRQTLVKSLLASFMRMSAAVEKMGLFSPKNETVDDIMTLDLKFLLVSFYLGMLFSRIQATPDHGTQMMNTMHQIRKKNLANAKAQFTVFLQRCEQLQAMTLTDSEYWSRVEEADEKRKDAYAQRTEKIERLKRKNALDAQVEQQHNNRDAIAEKLNLKTLEDMENSSEFEEAERAYQISRIKQAILQAISDMEMYNAELEMLEGFLSRQQMGQQKQSEQADARVASRLLRGSSSSSSSVRDNTQKPNVIVTNPDAIERQGGLRFSDNGAPTLVKLTPSDFSNSPALGTRDMLSFRQEKLREMFTERNPATVSLEELAAQEMQDLRLREASDQEAQKQREIPDEEQDRDEHVDRETYKAREWDDWKDANPRGVGRLPQ